MDAEQILAGNRSHFCLQLLQFLFELLLIIYQLPDLFHHIVGACLDEAGNVLKSLLLFPVALQRCLPGYSFYASHTSGYAGFLHNRELTDFACSGDMRTATKFYRKHFIF